MSQRANVQAVIDGILAGKILDTFDRWYADDVVMSENGGEGTRGKAANRAREQAFVDNVVVHGASVGAVIVDGDRAAVEWTMDMTPKGGSRVTLRQVAVQEWRGGKIAREVFYHA
jgi:SnoaL-like protein